MQSNWVRLGPKVLRWFLPLGLILIAAGLFSTTRNLEAYNRSPYPLDAGDGLGQQHAAPADRPVPRPRHLP